MYREEIGMDWKNVIILDKDFNWKGGWMKESWMIMGKNSRINENKGCLDPSFLSASAGFAKRNYQPEEGAQSKENTGMKVTWQIQEMGMTQLLK